MATDDDDFTEDDEVGEGRPREERVIDFIDGTSRRKTPEEYVRQNVERSLVQEYRYTRDDIAVEFRIKVGSARQKVDLVIFREDAPRSQENILIIVECKKEGVSPHDKKEGIDQLKSYMASCANCHFGVWTNGSDERICLKREDSEGIAEFIEVIDFPLKGEAWRDTDVPTRLKLRPATGDNLLLAFKRCHNYISGNQGLQKPEAFWELLKIIFCKIEDERSLNSLDFYITNREQKSQDGQLKSKKRLDQLFAKVKTKYPTIFKPNDQIELNRTVLGYVVSQIQGYSLLESPVDVKGVAYEQIVGSNLRGDRGEFFTPRNACKMAVELLTPEAGKRIIDPSCGTGGFLVTAMNVVLAGFDAHARKRWRDPQAPTPAELAEHFRARQELMSISVVGLDINPNLVRATKMNMVMNNDGSGGLFQADSLKDPVTWSIEARERAQLGTFDYVFTNPPFGTKIRIDSPEVLHQYELAANWDYDDRAHRWKKRIGSDGKPVLQGALPPEILFIERALQFLRPGVGRMAIVIPNGILNNPPLGYLRQWLLDNAQILAIVDMQRDLFQPHNDTQTSMVFLRRKADAEKQKPSAYPIFTAVTDKIGHDKRGRNIYKRDVDGSDIIETRKTKAKVVEDGKIVEKEIEERGPAIDDQLPEIPRLYRAWAKEHGQ
jgi:type I restriction enzyme M protein